MLHKIVSVLNEQTMLSCPRGKHRVGRVVHMGDISLNNPLLMYFDDGVIVTSPVKSWTSKITGEITVHTKNSIYYLQSYKY